MSCKFIYLILIVLPWVFLQPSPLYHDQLLQKNLFSSPYIELERDIKLRGFHKSWVKSQSSKQVGKNPILLPSLKGVGCKKYHRILGSVNHVIFIQQHRDRIGNRDSQSLANDCMASNDLGGDIGPAAVSVSFDHSSSSVGALWPILIFSQTGRGTGRVMMYIWFSVLGMALEKDMKKEQNINILNRVCFVSKALRFI